LDGQPLPALRNVNVVPHEEDGESYFCVTDPLGFVEEQLLLTPAALYVATSLDGVSTAADIRAHCEAKVGLTVPEEDMQSLVALLDESGFLLTPRFEALRDQVTRDFQEASTRPCLLAGKGYPDDPEALREYLDVLLTLNGKEPLTAGDPAARPVPCLVAPHIDFPRGSKAYSAGYRAFYGGGRPDTVFIFGVAHMGVSAPFTLTRKAFETPLGTLETNQDAVDALAAACAWDPFEHEFVHRGEHSIEFQAVMLAHLYGPAVKIVPVLCSSFGEDGDVVVPGEKADLNRFLEACRAYAAEPGRRVSVIAAADLAHVGMRFGDDFEVDDEVSQAVTDRDQEDLAHVAANAPEAFYASVMRDGNARRVCGLGCIYAALRTVDGTAGPGQLHAYGQAEDPNGGIVSFASIAFS